MIIGVDASKITSKQKTGVENTVYSLLLNLLKQDSRNTYYMYTPKTLPTEFKAHNNVVERLIPLKRLWHKFRLPFALLKDKPDVFIELSNSLPAFAPEKSMVMIHDVAFKIFPKAYSSFELYAQESAVKAALRNAKRILLTSQSNVDDFNRFYEYPKEKISIIPLAYNAKIFKKNLPVKKNSSHPEKPYFLFVGRLEERKNVANIVLAFYKFKKATKSDTKLILAGKEGQGYNKIKEIIEMEETLKKDVVISGFTSTDKLVNFYSNAIALVFPSLYEGFGLPILEAFACQTPVIISDIPTQKETAGDAGLLVNQEDPEDIANKMIAVASSQKLRQELIKKGEKRVKDFSWEISAKKLLEVINKI